MDLINCPWPPFLYIEDLKKEGKIFMMASNPVGGQGSLGGNRKGSSWTSFDKSQGDKFYTEDHETWREANNKISIHIIL